jgi:hypothetical protein
MSKQQKMLTEATKAIQDNPVFLQTCVFSHPVIEKQDMIFWQDEKIYQYNDNTAIMDKRLSGPPFRFLSFMVAMGGGPFLALCGLYAWIYHIGSENFHPTSDGMLWGLGVFMGSMFLSAYLSGKFMPRKWIVTKEQYEYLQQYEKAHKDNENIKKNILGQLNLNQTGYDVILSLDKLKLNLIEKYGLEFINGFYAIDNLKNELIKQFDVHNIEEVFNLLLKIPTLQDELNEQWNKYQEFKKTCEEPSVFKKGYEDYLNTTGVAEKLQKDMFNIRL